MSTVPVTVVGGYLGAGKTTLINRLLAGTDGRRLAVLVNDFGTVNIDAELIADHQGETLALTNGCVCCSIGNDLGDALERLRGTAIVHVVIEASGAALPHKAAAIAETWPGYRLAGTRVLVDAIDWRRQLADKFVGTLVRDQLKGTELRLVSKLDLSPDPDAELTAIVAQFGDAVPSHPAALFGLPAATAAHGAEGHVHLSTATFEREERLDHASARAALADLTGVLERAKGWIRTERGTFEVQLAGRRLAFELAEPRSTRLVLIGPAGTVAAARARLEALP